MSVLFSVLQKLSWKCPVFSLSEIPFLEVFFRRLTLSVNFLWDMLGTMSLNFVCFEFSHLLVHLLMESILSPCCISDGDSWVLGCRCFAFFEAVFASESASSFSSILWWAGQYILIWCFPLLDLCPWGSHELLLYWNYDSYLCS